MQIDPIKTKIKYLCGHAFISARNYIEALFEYLCEKKRILLKSMEKLLKKNIGNLVQIDPKEDGNEIIMHGDGFISGRK